MSAETTIRFDDGAAYERMMGVWSRIAGEQFLAWLSPPSGLSWLDVGCGSGAFAALVGERCAPAALAGVDPSAGQLAFARQRPGLDPDRFLEGGAEALPFADTSFDAAVMALVLFFVPNPPKGVAEMVRVTRPGGLVSAYVWDIPGGGLPMEPIHTELRERGMSPPRPPSFEVSTIPELERHWREGGLTEVATQVMPVERTFASFDEYWSIHLTAPTVAPIVPTLSASDLAGLKEAVRQRCGFAAEGPITARALANAVKGIRA